MLKKETLNLISIKNSNFKDIFSICIGKNYIYQRRFIDYVGKYNQWDVDVKTGELKLDDKVLKVEFIGTTSAEDNCWFSSEIEKVIPDEFVKIMINARKNIEALGIEELSSSKITLNPDKDINGYNLSMIYIAFCDYNVAYFCGESDNTRIYMFVKELPEEIFRKISSVEFSTAVMEMVATFKTNHKLMIKALLIENDIPFIDEDKNLKARFNEESEITVEFDDNYCLKNIYGMLSK